MKKAVSILALAMAAALCGPAYASSFSSADGAKKPQPQQLAKKGSKSKKSKKA